MVYETIRRDGYVMHWILIALSTAGISDWVETANKEQLIWDTFFNAGYLSLAACATLV